MWRKVDIYNVFVLKTVDLLREAGKDISLEYDNNQKNFRLYVCIWDKLVHVQIVNRNTHLQIVFQFCKLCDMEKDNPEGVFFKRLSGYHLEFPDLHKAQGDDLPLPVEIFQPSKKCEIKLKIASYDVILAENINSKLIANYIAAAMKYCGRKWNTAARGHVDYLEHIQKNILDLLD